MSLQGIKGSERKEEGKDDPGKSSLGGRKEPGREINYDPIIKLLIVLILVVFSTYAYLSLTKPADPAQDSYPYSGRVLGIAVNSYLPLESIEGFKTILLLNSSDSAVTSCNYELSAISELDRKGYLIRVERNRPGIYITDKGAWIRGRNNREILFACTAFSCLREGINCPDNLSELPHILAKQRVMNLVIDSNLGEKSFQKGIITMGYALGTIQSRTGAPIHTWLRNGNTCFLATVLNSTGFSRPNITRNSSCDSIDGIHLLSSGQGEIRMEGNRVILQGSDEQVYAETVIIQNLLAPDLQERLRKLNLNF